MGLITRQIGPDAKGSKLTFVEMDDNLYYLQGLGVSGLTYSANTLTITNPTGGTKSVTINAGNTFTGGTVSGATQYTNGLSANTISATTYQNLPDNVTGNYLPLSGGTVTGQTSFTNGLNTNTISATTYQNLPTDVRVTGASYSNNTFTYTNNTGGTFNTSFNTVTGLTSTGTIQSSILSATTYQNLPTDIRVTGGTYSAGTITFINNTGGTFNVTGITKTLNNEWLIASGTTVEIESFTQKFLYGDLYVSGLLQLNENSQLVILNGDLILSGGTISGSGQTTLVDLPTVNDLISSGTYSAGTLTLSTLNGSDVFINGFYTGTTQFTNGLTANTISATTYQNLPDNVTGKYLPLSGGTVTGSTFFTNGLTANTISATTLQSSNTYIESTGYLYFGNSSTDGSWRMSISGANFIVEKRVSGNWIISGTFN